MRLNRSIIIAAFFWIIIGGLLAYLAYSALNKGYIRFNYPSERKFPIRGIDISHHQGQIDWQQLNTEQLQFAYIKATEGGDHNDRLFQKNWQDAQKIGLTTGVYHFFTFCRKGIEQAEHFIRTVPLAASQLPPAIDLEFGGNCSKIPDKKSLLTELRIYIEAVSQAYQQTPIIYATYDSYARFLQDEALPNIRIWMRDIYKYPKLADGRKWIFWQFAHQGRLAGVKGVIDLNVFNGNMTEFTALQSTRNIVNTPKTTAVFTND